MKIHVPGTEHVRCAVWASEGVVHAGFGKRADEGMDFFGAGYRGEIDLFGTDPYDAA